MGECKHKPLNINCDILSTIITALEILQSQNSKNPELTKLCHNIIEELWEGTYETG